MKFASLNGTLTAESEAVVPIMDRSFLYGDGLFETLRIRQSRPCFWRRHLERLHLGARTLGIPLPWSDADVLRFTEELIQRNQEKEGVLRLHLSRGVGPRGYSPTQAKSPTLVITTHPLPSVPPALPIRWRLVTSVWPLPPFSPLTPIKTANKLVSVMARAEAEAVGMNEALMLNADGKVVEGAASNVFWIEDGRLVTPPLTLGALAGVTRDIVLELARDFDIPVSQPEAVPEVLKRSEGVFLTLSTWGIVSAMELDGRPLPESPLTLRLQRAYDVRLQGGDSG